MLRTSSANPEVISLEHFYQLVEKHAADNSTKDRIAIYFDPVNKITYAELNSRANKLANYFIEAKQDLNAHETRVGLFFNLSIEYIVSMLAVMKSGLTFVPLSANNELTRLQDYGKENALQFIITSTSLKSHLFLTTTKCKILFLDNEAKQINLHSFENLNKEISLHQVAYIHNTSGSTGKPKQILINHSGLLNCATDLIQRLHITAEDRIAAFSDLSFDAHIAEMMMTLGAGACLYILPAKERLDFSALKKYYRAHAITVSTLTPSVIKRVSPKEISSLRVLLSTGEAVTKEIVELWCTELPHLLFVNGYGPAEVTIATSLAILRPKDTIHIGTPIKGLAMYVLEKEPKNLSAPNWVEPGLRGEIYISGDGVGRGYTDAQLTEERFRVITDPNNPLKSIRVYQTRDEGFYEKDTIDGSLRFYVSGRLDRQVKVYGKLICPEEIEEILVNQDVLQAQIDPQIDEFGDPAFIAYLQVRDGFDLYEYYRTIAKKQPASISPAKWVYSTEAKYNTSYKNALKSMEEKAVRAQSHSPCKPSTPIELDLATIWKEILGIKENFEFTLDDNFFMLGGTSIQMASLLHLLKEKFSLKLSEREFVDSPTIGVISRRIHRKSNKDLHINKPLFLNKDFVAENDKNPLFLIHSLIGDAELDYRNLTDITSRPLYVINTPTLIDINDMDNTLNAIAYDYIKTMRAIKSKGPYLIGGWSAGGIIAYAMAQILKDQNEIVFLHMIDSKGLLTYQLKTREEYADYLDDLYTKKLRKLLKLPVHPVAKEALAMLPKSKQIYTFFHSIINVLNTNKAALEESAQTLLQRKLAILMTAQNTLLAIMNYDPKRKLDNVMLWAASGTQRIFQSKRLCWREEEVEFSSIHELDGDHDSILIDLHSAKNLGSQLEKVCDQQMKPWEHKEDIYDRIEQLRQRMLHNKDIDEELAIYIHPNCANPAAMQNVQDLKQTALNFIASDKLIFMLIGGSGSGKTTFNRYLERALWQQYEPDHAIPIFISLPFLDDPQNDILGQALANLSFSDADIEELKTKFSFTLILDAYDETNLRKNLYVSNQFHDNENRIKLVISCRTDYRDKIGDYKHFFVPYTGERRREDLFEERSVVPFNPTQIEKYIIKYIEINIKALKESSVDAKWYDSKTYLEQLDKIRGLNELITNPYLLYIAMLVLPKIVELYESLEEKDRFELTGAKLYDQFVIYWFTRVVDKMVVHSDEGFHEGTMEDFYVFSTELASIMKLNNLSCVTYIPARNRIFASQHSVTSESKNPFEKFFSDRDPSIVSARKGCPLRTLGEGRYAFIHPSVGDYFNAQYIYDFVKKREPGDALKHMHSLQLQTLPTMDYSNTLEHANYFKSKKWIENQTSHQTIPSSQTEQQKDDPNLARVIALSSSNNPS